MPELTSQGFLARMAERLEAAERNVTLLKERVEALEKALKHIAGASGTPEPVKRRARAALSNKEQG